MPAAFRLRTYVRGKAFVVVRSWHAIVGGMDSQWKFLFCSRGSNAAMCRLVIFVFSYTVGICSSHPPPAPSNSSLFFFWYCFAYFRFSFTRVSPELRLLQSVGYFLRQSSVESLDRRGSLSFPCPGRLRFQESFGRELFFIS